MKAFIKYSTFVFRFPICVIFLWLFLFFIIWLLILTSCPLPDFSEPTEGFISRGTSISERYGAWRNLADVTLGIPLERIRNKRETNSESRAILCDKPRSDYIHLIYSSTLKIDLSDFKTIKNICRIERRISKLDAYRTACISKRRQCCAIMSIVGQILVEFNATACKHLEENHVLDFTLQMKTCINLSATRQKESNKCYRYLTVFDYFLPVNATLTYPTVSEFAVFLPIARGRQTRKLFDAITNTSTLTARAGLTLIAANFGLKYSLLDSYLISDSVYVVLALLLVVCIVATYVPSLIVVIFLLLILIFSTCLAYVVYFIRLPVFPFINCLAVVLLVATGTDDLLVFAALHNSSHDDGESPDADEETLALRPDESSERSKVRRRSSVEPVLRKALPSLFTTSFTTAVALLSNIASPIVAIRLFSVFATLCVAFNFITEVVLLPPVFVLMRKRSWCMCDTGLRRRFSSIAHRLFDRLASFVLRSASYLVCFHVLLLAICALGLFVWPKFKMSSTKTFQVFEGDHILERYDHISGQFLFGQQLPYISVAFVFGVMPISNLDAWDPRHLTARFISTPDFNMSTIASQRWLNDFCWNLWAAPEFLYESPLTNCFPVQFHAFMRRPCDAKMDRRPCCGYLDEVTFAPSVFETCLRKHFADIRYDPAYLTANKESGVRFNTTTGEILGLIIEYVSNVSVVSDFANVRNFYDKVNTWFDRAVANAPPSFNSGFVTGDFEWFSLFDSLIAGFTRSVGIASAVVLLAVLFTLRRVVISLVCFVHICGVAMTSATTLMLLGWTLGVIESLFLVLVSGLAIDLPLHFVVMILYCDGHLSHDVDECLKSRFAAIFPVTFGAALTTLVTGLVLRPATILAYKQLGAFLIVISLSSIVHVFFFLPASVYIMRNFIFKQLGASRRQSNPTDTLLTSAL